MTFTIPSHVFTSAVRQFWRTRRLQVRKQRTAGRADQGNRGAATGGRQLDGFLNTIAHLLHRVGVPTSDIHLGRGRTELPGFYRAEKGWDLVVTKNHHLLAAIELKSQVGPSFGNNFNNRTEEALGTALDTWRAYRELAFGSQPQPWLGYLFLLEDVVESRRDVRVIEPHFSVLKEFCETSYAQRYEIFCRKLVLERQFSAACFLTSRSNATSTGRYAKPAPDLDAEQFLKQLLGHIAPHYH